ncbi:MAG: CDP-alcohol phosphatidyltransferase family protein [Bacteroidota bacterium]|nr:CDP-alcohol phosphatidyltransferase family protein [Bacteroidota bacterium]
MINQNTTIEKDSAPPSGLSAIPNIFTLLNLFFGCMAIVFALQTNSVIIYLNDQFNSSFNIPEKLTWAAICIIIAALIDFLDGFVARLLKATSELGKQLDSLSDVVSFGVAPAVIIFQLLRFSFAREENGLDVSIIWMMPAFIIACAAAYRLGKFNLDTDQQFSFKGVPVPAVGLLIASLPLILHFNEISGVNSFLLNKWVLYALIIVISYLMISNHRMMSLKFSDFTFKNNRSKIILFVIAIIAALFLQWLAVPVVFIFYILLSLIKPKIKPE